MENNLIKTMTDSFQLFTDMSVNAMKATLENSATNLKSVNRNFSSTKVGDFTLPMFGIKNSDCCPPKQECPPHCILEISREAFQGERIIIPIMIKNDCQVSKTYKVGVRDLVSIDGSTAPTQPILNKQTVSLDPGHSVLVLMRIDMANFPAGQNYQTEIVLREKEYNQNICFNLHVKGFGDAPIAQPVDEKKYKLKWQSWRSHFYCEPGVNNG